MNLRPRFHLLTILLFIAAAIPGWLAVRALADGIVDEWAVRYAEQQVLHDKSRLLQPVLRELALARQLAGSQLLHDWARHPNDAQRARRAFAELESYRQNFQDKSYFVALARSGQYFHNNAKSEFSGRELRYVLDPENKKDAWFYELIHQQNPLNLNVNTDRALGITKLWINVLVRDGDDILGITGTGLDLTAFVRDVLEPGVAGISTLLVDQDGAIQLHRNQALIDYASISKSPEEQNTVKLLFEREADRESIVSAMHGLERGDDKVVTRFVMVDGRRHLAGLIYLPEIAWYQITLIDLETLLPFRYFGGLLLLYGVSLVALLMIFNLGLRIYVLKPLAQLDAAITVLEAGQAQQPPVEDISSGEIRDLMARFSHMAATVLEARHDLENKVLERTQALDRLTKIDPLSELFNRRGMSERLEAELDRAHRGGSTLGILWLDIDYFKQINDRHGHALGDQVLKQIAAIILQTIRRYDVASRWGGDEFLVLISPTDKDNLDRLGERLRLAVAESSAVLMANGQPLTMSVSIGGYLAAPGEPLQHILQCGDEALYLAKAAGRNAYCSFTA